MKKIITYFSATGTTRKAAEELAKVAGADLFEIQPAQPYTSADLDWRDKTSRTTLEMKDQSSRPALAESKIDLSAYDVVYIGFPIWWGVPPHVVNTFIESHDLTGKQVVVFATSGGSGLDPAVKVLKQRYPNLNIKAGKMLNGKVTKDIFVECV